MMPLKPGHHNVALAIQERVISAVDSFDLRYESVTYIHTNYSYMYIYTSLANYSSSHVLHLALLHTTNKTFSSQIETILK